MRMFAGPDNPALSRGRIFARAGAAARFELRAAADGAEEILIYDEIGFWGITAKAFVEKLAAVKGPTLRVRINSPGGDVFDGLAIFNALRRASMRVETHVDGIAASMASVVMLAGETVAVAENAMVMIHKPWGLGIGDDEEMLKLAELLRQMNDTMAGIYVGATGQDAETVMKWMAAETWFTGAEAVAEGFADTMTPNFDTKALAAYDLSAFKNPPKSSTPAPANPAPPSSERPQLAALRRAIDDARRGA